MIDDWAKAIFVVCCVVIVIVFLLIIICTPIDKDDNT